MQESFPLRKRSADALEAEPLDRLAQAAAAGDRAAFETIYTALVDDLYLYLRGQCGDDTTAEDLAANVFLKAWRSAKRYRAGSGRYRSWVFAIARNELRDHWKSRRRTEPLNDEIPEAIESPGRDQDEVQRMITFALDELTAEQREIVVLRYFGNHSHAEIGEMVGKREGAVRALLFRALKRMRKAIGDAALE